jgi:hypothetical protein
MGKGQAMMQELQEALGAFEDSVVRREHKRMLESKVALQQEVDKRRQAVVDVVVGLIRGQKA